MEFENAFLPKQKRVLGVSLEPFSLWHLLALQALDNRLLDPTHNPTRENLLAAVLVCSRNREKMELVKRGGCRLKIWWLNRLSRAFKLEPEVKKWNEYIRDAFSIPVLLPVDSANSSRLLGGPYVLRLVQWLKTSYGLTEVDAWNRPYAQSVWEWATWAEARGEIRIQNQEEADADQWFAEQEALEKGEK